MRINRHTSLLLAAAVALAVAAPAAADKTNDPQAAKDTSRESLYRDCSVEEGSEGDYTTSEPSENYIEFNGDDVLWPPNHKDVISTVRAVDNTGGAQEDGPVTLMTSARHDEVLADGTELNGSGNTPVATDAEVFDADASGDGVAETDVNTRAERSGRGDGRTYTIEASATFDDEPGNCSATFTIEVPHDMRSDNAPEKGTPSLDENGEPKGGGNG